jgi:RNA polymerase sigma-32 factor
MTLHLESASGPSAQARPPGYLDEIRRFPLLEPQQEYMLAKSWCERRERGAAHRLVTSHLRMVVKLAAGYRRYGLPMSELVSEGNVGLMLAVNRFEPDRGCRFATYAKWWIKAAIQEYVLHSWSIVKIGTTANQRKLFFGLRRAKSQIAAIEDGDLRPDQVEAIAGQLHSAEWHDLLVDDRAGPDVQLVEAQQGDNRQRALSDALTVLNPRERRIFEARQLPERPVTREELADEFSVSRERVRQIEARAFEKVRNAVKARIAVIEGA